MNKDITIWAAGKAVGAVRNGAFVKRVQASKHFLQRPPAICLDLASLADAEKAGARRVEVTDIESGRVYRADVRTIRQHGQRLDRGHGAQIALGLGRWDCEDPAIKYRQLDWLAGVKP